MKTLIPLFAALLISLPAQAQDEEVAALIQKLGDPSWKIRDEAGRRLVDFGGDAEESLLIAAESDDPTVATAARYYHTLIESGLTRSADSPELKKMMEDYNQVTGVSRVDIIHRVSRLPVAESQAVLLRIIGAETDPQIGEFAILAALWNLPVEVDFPSVLTFVPAADSPAEKLSDAEIIASWQKQKTWLTERKLAVEQLLAQARIFRNKKSSMDRLTKYLEIEQRYLDRILRFLDAPAGAIPEELSGESLLNTYYEMIDTQARNLPQTARSLGTVTQLGLSYYAADFAERLGFRHDADLFLRKTRESASLAFSSVSYNSVSDRGEGVRFRLSWISRLMARGRIDWGIAEAEKLWSSCMPTEISIAAQDLAEIHHTLGNDKRAAELINDILSSSLKRLGLQNLRKDLAKRTGDKSLDDSSRVLNDYASLARYYMACEASREGDFAQMIKFIDDSLAKNPENCETLILAYESAESVGDSTWKADIESKIETALTKCEERMRQSVGFALTYERNQYAWLAVKTNRHLETAAGYAEKNVIENPNRAMYRDTLAHIYFVAGHVEDAIKHQERAVADEPESLDIRRALEVFKGNAK